MLLKTSVDADRCGGAASKGSRESASRGRASHVLRLPMAPTSTQIPTASTTGGAVFERNLAALAARMRLQALSGVGFEGEVTTEGRHDQAGGHCSASTCAAQIRSLRVMPPAECVLQRTVQRL